MNPKDLNQQQLNQLLRHATVLPIFTLTDADLAVPLAAALVEGGVTVFEIPLRTAVAAQAIAAIARALPQVCIGAGTVTSAHDLMRAQDAGAQFILTPGLDPELIAVLQGSALPSLPGVHTASEILTARRAGFLTLKWYPAKAAGGAAVLKDLASIYPDIEWVPTGQIGAADVRSYKDIPAVLACGGSWVAPKDLIAAKDWAAITALARKVFTLLKD
jgi:2-dehydro-3-deoxyphosphogluconate aldolase / (4S)-4-hydroxy-2-oxoglutarate aldolase